MWSLYSTLGRNARYILYGPRRAGRIERSHNHRRLLKKQPNGSTNHGLCGGRSRSVRLLHPRVHSSREGPAKRGTPPDARNDSYRAFREHMQVRWLLENCGRSPQSQQPPQNRWRPLAFSSHRLRSSRLAQSGKRCKLSTNTEKRFVSSRDQPMFP
jgi:hypothetical protein